MRNVSSGHRRSASLEITFGRGFFFSSAKKGRIVWSLSVGGLDGEPRTPRDSHPRVPLRAYLVSRGARGIVDRRGMVTREKEYSGRMQEVH